MDPVFVREIPAEKITDEMIKDFENRGLKIVYTEDSIEIWSN